MDRLVANVRHRAIWSERAPILVLALIGYLAQAWPVAAECPSCSQPSFGPAARSFTARYEGIPYYQGALAKFVVVGDFNNDGVPDVALDADTVLIYIGTGSGTYLPPAAVPGFNAGVLAAADFDGDGNLDVLSTLGGPFHVLLGDGQGGFPRSKTSAPPVGAALGVVGDFDGDRIPDVAAPTSATAITLYRGAGDGSFSPMQTIAVGSGTGVTPRLVPRVGDFNQDGIDDLAVASTGDGQIGILLGHLGGGLTVAYAPDLGPSAGDLRIGYVDGDEHLDLVAESQLGPFGTAAFAVLRGFGNGTFELGPSFPVGYQRMLDVGDFDGNGSLDILASPSVGDDYGLHVHPGNGDGTFATPLRTVIYVSPAPMLVAADLNLDGKLDVALPDWAAETFTALLGKGDGHFEEAPRFSTNMHSLQGIVSADFNNDGDLDVAVSAFQYGQVGILLGDGAGGFDVPRISTVQAEQGLVAADFNHDGKMDVAVASGFEELYVLLGSGDGNLGPPILTPKEHQHATMAVADFDNDGNPDIMMNIGKFVLYRGNGDGTFGTPSTIAPLASPGFAVGDVNADDKADLLLTMTKYSGGTSTTTLLAMLGQGDGTFSNPISSPAADTVHAMALGDMNSDANVDVVMVYPYSKAVGILLGDGTGSFLPSPVTETNFYPYSSIALADFTGDGLLDAVVEAQDNVAVFAGIVGGHLAPARIFRMPGTPVGAAVGDFDADEKPDVAVATLGGSYGPDFVVMLRNTSCEPRRLAIGSEVNACVPPGAPFPADLTLRTLDDGDNVVCAEGSVSASLVPGSGSPGASLGGTTSVPVLDGVATFTDLTVSPIGTLYQLEFVHSVAGTTRSRLFTVGSAPSVAIEGPASICTSGSYSATAGFDTYAWSVGGAGVGSRESLTLSGHAIGRGFHSLQVTATRDGCEATASVPIQVTLPDVTLTAPPTVCPYANAIPASVPDAGPGATYAWTITNGVITSGAGTRAIQFHVGPADLAVGLSVTVTDEQTCSDSASRTVTVDRAGCPPPIGFYTVTPCRVLDTRDPNGPWGGPALVPASARRFTFTNRCGIPADATAVALNVAVTQATAQGNLALFPGGTTNPTAATINYRPGVTRANNAIISLGAEGDIAVFCNQGPGSSHVIVDVSGYFR